MGTAMMLLLTAFGVLVASPWCCGCRCWVVVAAAALVVVVVVWWWW
jgi:hypothetical protein